MNIARAAHRSATPRGGPLSDDWSGAGNHSPVTQRDMDASGSRRGHDPKQPQRPPSRGRRFVYALICKTCHKAVIYGDESLAEPEPDCSGYEWKPVPYSTVHRKPACVCGIRHYTPAQGEMFTEGL